VFENIQAGFSARFLLFSTLSSLLEITENIDNKFSVSIQAPLHPNESVTRDIHPQQELNGYPITQEGSKFLWLLVPDKKY